MNNVRNTEHAPKFFSWLQQFSLEGFIIFYDLKESESFQQSLRDFGKEFVVKPRFFEGMEYHRIEKL